MGSWPAFIALTALAIPPMMTNTYVGMAEVDAEVREAARGMGMSGRQVLWRVEAAMALPLIMAGVRTAAVGVVATATLASVVGFGGLGSSSGSASRSGTTPRCSRASCSSRRWRSTVELSLALVQRLLVSQGLRRGGERIAREIAGADDAFVAAAATARIPPPPGPLGG